MKVKVENSVVIIRGVKIPLVEADPKHFYYNKALIDIIYKALELRVMHCIEDLMNAEGIVEVNDAYIIYLKDGIHKAFNMHSYELMGDMLVDIRRGNSEYPNKLFESFKEGIPQVIKALAAWGRLTEATDMDLEALLTMALCSLKE